SAYNARLANRTDMIRLSQVTLRRGARTLLEGADVGLNPGDKIGLIGANGSGKSSLFALLRGELHADKGEVDYPARWRVAYVAQALMCPSDLLLLDEPTNHLDLDAILWLEEWLKRYAGTLLIVSHDRDFLDGVVEAIVHIDAKKLRRYSGNYSSFERQRAEGVVLAAAQYEKQQREREHLESFINRFRAKATKARQAQSR